MNPLTSTLGHWLAAAALPAITLRFRRSADRRHQPDADIQGPLERDRPRRPVQRPRRLLQCLALSAATAALLTVVPAHAQRSSAPKPLVPVANFTGWSDVQLSQYLTETLRPEIQQTIRERGMVVVATAWTTELRSAKACFASVGLAEAPPKGRNPRWPTNTSQSFAFGQSQDCYDERIRDAVGVMNEAGMQSLLQGIEQTANAGGTRTAMPADTGMVRLHRSGGFEYDDAPLFEKLHAFSLGEALDYRHAMTTVRSFALRFDNGKIMCVAETGFTARNADGRAARMPASLSSVLVLRDGGESAECLQAAALAAVDRLVKDTWVGKNGRLSGFERAREDGVPLPDLKRAAAVEKRLMAAAQPAAQQVATRSQQVNRVTCTNQCFNGDCIRTFPDGRKERWQAPRVFDPFSRDWKWDTNSCGT